MYVHISERGGNLTSLDSVIKQQNQCQNLRHPNMYVLQVVIIFCNSFPYVCKRSSICMAMFDRNRKALAEAFYLHCSEENLLTGVKQRKKIANTFIKIRMFHHDLITKQLVLTAAGYVKVQTYLKFLNLPNIYTNLNFD